MNSLKNAAGDEEKPLIFLAYDHSGKIVSVNHGPIPTDKNEPVTGFTLCTACNRWIMGKNGVQEHLDTKNELKRCWKNGTEQDIIRNIILYTDTRHDVIKIDVPEPFDAEGNALPEELYESFYKTLAQAMIEGIQISMNVDVDEVRYFLTPDPQNYKKFSIIIYETSEGGAGILESFIIRSAFHDSINHSLVILHEYDEDKCDRACYECLCNYYNQQDHELLDRKLALPVLRRLLKADIVSIADNSQSSKKNFDEMLELCESDFERRVLKEIYNSGISLPDSNQTVISEGDEMIARPDFLYSKSGHSIAVFADGPDHDRVEIKKDDERKRSRLDLMGYSVFSINYKDDLESKLQELSQLLG